MAGGDEEADGAGNRWQNKGHRGCGINGNQHKYAMRQTVQSGGQAGGGCAEEHHNELGRKQQWHSMGHWGCREAREGGNPRRMPCGFGVRIAWLREKVDVVIRC
jgi:hypothetical protein